MTQAAPDLASTGTIDIPASTQSQQRGPHGAFRYFGKLPPDVTGAILDAAAELTDVNTPVVDLMCGSGTTLIEACARGWTTLGFDVNPVANLYTRVKTRSLNHELYRTSLETVCAAPKVPFRQASDIFAATRNADRWFSRDSMQAVASLKAGIESLESSPESEALFAVLLGRLRRISNASARTGRIFFDPASAEPAVSTFQRSAHALLTQVPSMDLAAESVLRDGRATQLPDHFTDLCFCHPPYFALYRYSADVLRFEMEIGGFDRRRTNSYEIREGWKSGDITNLDSYIDDMGMIFQEARRILRKGGVFAIVASNSTLGDLQLPVIDRFAARLSKLGFEIAEHLVRKAHFGSAKYHKSARIDKFIQQDHVLLCTR